MINHVHTSLAFSYLIFHSSNNVSTKPSIPRSFYILTNIKWLMKSAQQGYYYAQIKLKEWYGEDYSK